MPSSGKTFKRLVGSVSASKLGRLLIGAAVLHVAMAILLFSIGRAHILPGLIDNDGIIPSFAFDSYEYQQGALRLAEHLRQGEIKRWAVESAPVHVRLISVCFAVLGPLFGYGPLAAEPFNLLCYLALLALTFALAREISGEGVGLISVGIVALWPTLLLHSLQLLKDPLFIVLALAVMLCAMTWLTQTFSPRKAISTGAVAVLAIPVLVLIRSSFLVVILGIILFSLGLLGLRQLVERRVLYWNMIGPLLIVIATVVMLLAFQSPPTTQKLKVYSSNTTGPSKSRATNDKRVAAVVSYGSLPDFEEGEPTLAKRFKSATHRAALRVDNIRQRYVALYPQSGSNIDVDVIFRDPGSIVRYLPRAFVIGCCAPFPTTWATAGVRVGNAGKLLAGAETLLMYLFGVFAIVGAFRRTHRLAAWYLLSITVFSVTLLGLVVPNIGALYRFRYTFWVLLIILGVKGLVSLVQSFRASVTASKDRSPDQVMVADASIAVQECYVSGEKS